MTKDEVCSRIREIAIIPAIRVLSGDDAHFAAEAVMHGGIPIVEITMTVPGALELMAHLIHSNPELHPRSRVSARHKDSSLVHRSRSKLHHFAIVQSCNRGICSERKCLTVLPGRIDAFRGICRMERRCRPHQGVPLRAGFRGQVHQGGAHITVASSAVDCRGRRQSAECNELHFVRRDRSRNRHRIDSYRSDSAEAIEAHHGTCASVPRNSSKMPGNNRRYGRRARLLRHTRDRRSASRNCKEREAAGSWSRLMGLGASKNLSPPKHSPTSAFWISR